jgi:amino acid permease
VKDKDFIIPKNVNARFEIIPNVSMRDKLFFIPSILIDVSLFLFVPINPVAKVVISAVTLFIPFALVFIRPIRPNIPIWKHIKWKLEFGNRQKKFYYRKEVVPNVPKK